MIPEKRYRRGEGGGDVKGDGGNGAEHGDG